MKETITREIELKEGVTARMDGKVLKLKGPKGENGRSFVHPKVKLELKGNKIVLTAEKGTKKEKKLISSFASHIKNMVRGVLELHVYKLKICSGHFPMTVTVSGKEFVVKNFLGEAVPRKATLPAGVEVKIDGNLITVSSVDKEIAGNTATKIENLCRIINRDRRIFQDGCYMIHKSGKEI
jgi:large subunit ribosomal protein L6